MPEPSRSTSDAIARALTNVAKAQTALAIAEEELRSALGRAAEEEWVERRKRAMDSALAAAAVEQHRETLEKLAEDD